MIQMDGAGIDSSLATAGIIAVRCVCEKYERLLVPDQASHNQCKYREWHDRPWMTFCTGLFMGLNLPEMLTQKCRR
jgi:hypothetical protein